MIDFPVIAVLGNRGDGKTLTMTELARKYQKEGISVFANYTLIGIPYVRITFEELASFPDWLHDGAVFMDEAHVGADAYDFFNKRVKDITKFVTQLRKRRLILYFSTQVFTQVAKRLRDQTDYLMDCRKTDVNGVIEVQVFDYRQPTGNGGFQLVNHFELDARESFDYYDTNEIIEIDEDD